MKRLLADSPRGILVIVHGAFEHSGRYDETAAFYQQQGFHVIYGDLPGQGKSSRRRGHIQRFDEYIDAICEWVEKAQSFELPVFLLGHSMGGLAVIRTMELRKLNVQAVLLSSPALGIYEKPTKPVEIVSRVLDMVYPKMKVETPAFSEKITRNIDVMERDRDDTLILDKISVRWYWEFVRGMKRAFKQIDDYPDVPTLIMQAGEDLMVNIDKTKDWFHKLDISEKSYKEWPSMYHEILNEPERLTVYQYMNSYLQFQLDKAMFVRR
ncbi:alpha/beta hydrolase [Thalassobacillus pellis]|uniref:alpha/beta hydrolase n=1 Tax=Thalassobacillus pellis TaxID=748008 RepID=UPI001960AF01|nr:alpha/beta hydrolase [Thalassobacillus pellis]MBM7554765.1 lysophospholipase [Thalassobacillus pellis]